MRDRTAAERGGPFKRHLRGVSENYRPTAQRSLLHLGAFRAEEIISQSSRSQFAGLLLENSASSSGRSV